MNPVGLIRAIVLIAIQAVHDGINDAPLRTPEAQAWWIQETQR